jgi:hypothetical protein
MQGSTSLNSLAWQERPLGSTCLVSCRSPLGWGASAAAVFVLYNHLPDLSMLPHIIFEVKPYGRIFSMYSVCHVTNTMNNRRDRNGDFHIQSATLAIRTLMAITGPPMPTQTPVSPPCPWPVSLRPCQRLPQTCQRGRHCR